MYICWMLIHCTHSVQNVFIRMEGENLSTKDTASNDIAVKYLGRALIALIIGIVLCFLASLGYNGYIRWSQKEIEVHAQNSNSQLNEID